jgi:3',5'-cyclic AMP phosphodiesterase CpdA
VRILAHLSDVHFGRIDYAVIDPLIKTIGGIEPDLVVVSGDLTQRARTQQFKEARAFLDALPSPQIVVPGNHDVPLHNAFARFLRPLHSYRRYITDDLQPSFIDEEIAVFGINTARSLTVKRGGITGEQLESIREKLCALGEGVTKIVVSHHPLDLPERFDERELVRRSRTVMSRLLTCGVDLFLAGHLHISEIGQTASRYRIGGYAGLIVQAGTATSTRGRGETNSFNIIRVERQEITVQRFIWQATSQSFTVTDIDHFYRIPGGWSRKY